jgi:hypothetical protein
MHPRGLEYQAKIQRLKPRLAQIHGGKVKQSCLRLSLAARFKATIERAEARVLIEKRNAD